MRQSDQLNALKSQGIPFIYEEHTAETAVYYAVDLGKSYRLIDESILEDVKLT